MKKIISMIIMTLSLSAFSAHKNIVDIAIENGNFKTLVSVLQLTGLDEVIRENKNLTVFAPTDEAFAKIPSDVLSSVLADKELLKTILLYHVAKPTLSAKVVSKLNGIKTLSGKYITNKNTDKAVVLNTSKVIATDIYAENGVIHVLDSVLIPNETTANNEISTVSYVDLNRYAGKWNELYRFPNEFEAGCYDVTAEYILKSNSKVSVLNTCVKQTGKIKTSKGTAFVTNYETNAQLKVSFVPLLQRWGIFAGDYNILDLGTDYEYALVGSKDRSYLWILARDESISAATYKKILDKAESLGYDTRKLIKTPSLK